MQFAARLLPGDCWQSNARVLFRNLCVWQKRCQPVSTKAPCVHLSHDCIAGRPLSVYSCITTVVVVTTSFRLGCLSWCGEMPVFVLLHVARRHDVCVWVFGGCMTHRYGRLTMSHVSSPLSPRVGTGAAVRECEVGALPHPAIFCWSVLCA
jgi:hypothetical protein